MSGSGGGGTGIHYIPPNKRNVHNRKKSQRFHGAFQGGFSAGYFNTVDTKEGWTPTERKHVSKHHQQKLEDFMDEQDHEEWGGPTKLRQDYNDNNEASSRSQQQKNDNDQEHKDEQDSGRKQPPISASLLGTSSKSLLQVSHQTVGPRLLRKLGWRGDNFSSNDGGTHTAFVPIGDHDNDSNLQLDNEDADDDNEAKKCAKIILSKKKLRQIQLHSTKFKKLPAPKLDLCGLGFEQFENAPEFREHKLKRQKLAQQRAQGGSSASVYRTSKLGLDSNDQNNNKDNAISGGNNLQNDYLSYETMEDFVGTKSVGGFALQDDADDAYDDDHHRDHLDREAIKGNKHFRRGGQEYSTEVYEHQDSDDENDTDPHHDTMGDRSRLGNKQNKASANKSGLATDFGGALASWAGTDPATSTTTDSKTRTTMLFTSDGRPPISGFQLGGSLESHRKRYPGPDIPRDFELRKHKFGPNEHPKIFQTLAHAVKLEQQQYQLEDVRNERNTITNPIESRKQLPPPPPPISLPPPPSRTMMMNTEQFAGLAAAMKNRFTTSSNTTTNNTEPESAMDRTQQQQQHAGEFHRPEPISKKVGNPTVDLPPLPSASAEKPISITRTIHSFALHPLVCKRLGIPVPKRAVVSTSNIKSSAVPEDRIRSKEAKYFENEIMPLRNEAAAAKGKKKTEREEKKAPSKSNSTDKNNTTSNSLQDKDDDNEQSLPVLGIERPPMEKLQSIFEPDSAEESSEPDTDLDSLVGDDDESRKGTKNNASDNATSSVLIVVDSPKVVHKAGDELGVAKKSSLSGSDGDDDGSRGSTDHSRRRHKQKRKKRGHHHNRHRRKDSKERRKKRKKYHDDDRYHRERKEKVVDNNNEKEGPKSTEALLSDTSRHATNDEIEKRRRRKRSRSYDSSSSRSSLDSRRKERHRRLKRDKGRRKKSDRKR